ncbi:hypothetical protein BH23ACT5_BH23ACT5_08680 [soil metagenome]
MELENPDPAQVTREEVAALVEEVHRQGYRVAAHCEGLEGTQIAIEEGVDTIEHGFQAHRRPDLLAQLASYGGVLVPTLSFLVGVADRRAGEWSTHLVERSAYNVAEATQTLRAALAAGVPIAMGFDSSPEERAASELGLMVDAGMSTTEALVAATSVGARAIGLDHLIGTVEPGKLAISWSSMVTPSKSSGSWSTPTAFTSCFRSACRSEARPSTPGHSEPTDGRGG